MHHKGLSNIGIPDGVDITGLQYVISIEYITLHGSYQNLDVLYSVPNLQCVTVSDIQSANFDIFANLPGPTHDGTITQQTINEPELEIKNNKLEIDLNTYVGVRPEILIDDVVVTIGSDSIKGAYNDSTRKIIVNDLAEIIDVDGDIKNYISENATVKFTETANFDGRIKQVPIKITQPFVIKIADPIVKAKDVTMYVNDNWDDDMGLEEAKNKYGGVLTASDLQIEGSVDTSKIGDTEITYRLKEDPSIFDTANVNVIKRPTGGGGTNNKVEDIKPTNIMTDKKSLDVYNVSGKKLEPKTLTKQTTDFVTEKINTIGKVQYYRIGENEWVKTDDVKVFHYNNAVKQTHGDDHKELTQFRNIGQVSNRALKPITNWVTDRYAYFKDEKYHRVATHEWVHDDHVVKYTSISGVVKVNENVPLYNSQGKESNRGLMNNSDFVTDKSAMINDQLMYRVATDEWVPAESVTLK